MVGAQLVFGDADLALNVHAFEVREAISRPFSITVVATSTLADLALDGLLGGAFVFRLGARSERTLRGVCLSAEHLGVERSGDGLASYRFELGPTLALLAHRSRYRVFQFKTIPEIALSLLAEWGIRAEVALDESRHPRLEYRVQLGESDLAFFSRMLEEAGIAFTFPAGRDEVDLLLGDDGHGLGEPTLLRHVTGHSNLDDRPAVSNVRVGRRLSTGRVVLRDAHFRLDSRAILRAESSSAGDARFERQEIASGASSIVTSGPTPTAVADARGAALPSARYLQQRAAQSLERDLARRREVSFEVTPPSVHPGLRARIEGHPSAELHDDLLQILETRTWFEPSSSTHRVAGEPDAERIHCEVQARFTDVPFRPPLVTRKPRALGLQSAVVVGPEGESIHTDEFGRVKVRFGWDDSGDPADETTSCWLRVSRSWAGAGHSAFMLPRVGDEVLVAFFDGDPDQPVIVGGVHNASSPVPYPLPENKRSSVWRSASVPATGGYNEILFEDTAGAERVGLRAERDLVAVVRETATVDIGGRRTTRVATTDDYAVGERHSIVITSGDKLTRIETTPGKITLTSGDARITLDGPNIALDAPGDLVLRAGGRVRVESSASDVVIQGGPYVRINPMGAGEHPASQAGAIPLELADGEGLTGFDDIMTEVSTRSWFDASRRHYFDELIARGGPLDPTPRGGPDDAVRAFKYAVAARCVGFPEGVVARRAGKLNRAEHGPDAGEGDPGNGVFGGSAPYGATKEQAEAMSKGFAYYDAHYGE